MAFQHTQDSLEALNLLSAMIMCKMFSITQVLSYKNIMALCVQ